MTNESEPMLSDEQIEALAAGPVAYLRTITHPDYLEVCSKESEGAFPVYASPAPAQPAEPPGAAIANAWIITAPDGRQWSGESPVRAAAAAQRDTIDPVLAMQRIKDMVDEENAIRDKDLADARNEEREALRKALRKIEQSHTGMCYGDEKRGGVSEYARGWGDCLTAIKAALGGRGAAQPAEPPAAQAPSRVASMMKALTDEQRRHIFKHAESIEDAIDMTVCALSVSAEKLQPAEPTSARPLAWIRLCSDGGYEGPIADCDKRMDDVRRKSGAWTPLYPAGKPGHAAEPPAAPTPDAIWDASQIKQPGWDHIMAAFIEGAREARMNPEATDDDFKRAADGYTKRVFEEVDPASEEALRTGRFSAATPAAEPPAAPDLAAVVREAATALYGNSTFVGLWHHAASFLGGRGGEWLCIHFRDFADWKRAREALKELERAAQQVQQDPPAAPAQELRPPAYMHAKLQLMIPLFQEARDAICAITETQRKAHGISPTLAERMDAAGTFSLDDWQKLDSTNRVEGA